MLCILRILKHLKISVPLLKTKPIFYVSLPGQNRPKCVMRVKAKAWNVSLHVLTASNTIMIKWSCDVLAADVTQPADGWASRRPHRERRWVSSYQLLNFVIIYSPSCCSKPVWVSFFCWTQNMIFWRMLVTKQLMVAIYVHSI